MKKGFGTIQIMLWLMGATLTIGLGWSAANSATNTKQDDKIYEINGQVVGLKTDISYIRETVDELKTAQQAELRARGISWSQVASSTKQ